MVAAALLGALVAPVLADAMGARALVLASGVVCLATILAVRIPIDRHDQTRPGEPALEPVGTSP
jgi:hypothetical protein